MIGITERAKSILLDLRESVEIPAPHGALRLAPNTAGQLELSIDVARDSDEVLRHDGDTLLVIASNVSQGFAGSTIDCARTPGGFRLALTRFPGRGNGMHPQ
jgi:hypothetical protein